MYTPVEAELQEAWDIIPDHTVRVTITGTTLRCDWIKDELSHGFMVAVVGEDRLTYPNFWLEPNLRDQGFFHDFVFKSLPYWKEQGTKFWVIPDWNDDSRRVFEEVGFRETEGFERRLFIMTGWALVADLQDANSPINVWYAAKLEEAGE